MTTVGAGPAHDVLQRASGVQLIGEMAGSGYRVPPSLVRRSDGQTIQLTPLLYSTLHEIDGRRTAAEVAEAVSASSGRIVSEENVRHLVDEQLRPLGLLTLADGAEPTVRKQNPLLGLRFRYAVTDPERTRRITAPFQFLFRPWMVVPLMAAFLAVCWWVFFEKGLASATYEAFQHPGLLILVFAVTVLSAGFHEFGHAAAARYGGSTPGAMGFGMYLVWPAFYTDVTDSYRLGRGGRVRTDLGGLYFNAIVAVAITGVWWATSYDALLLVVATQILQMIRQLQPLVRFDGYHVLADVTGVPDLFHRIKPTLLGALPWRWGDPEAALLKPWARVVVTAWVVIVVPLLIASLVLMVFALPRVMGTAWASLVKQQDVLAGAWSDGDLLQATARVLAMVAITIPMAGSVYMLVRLVRKSATGTWRATAGKPVKRVLAGIAGAAMIGGVAYAWWPHDGAYRPIQPTERGTVGDAVLMSGLPQLVGYAPRPAVVPYFVEGQQGVVQAVWDTTEPMPTEASPQLALVLVPKDQGTTDAPSSDPTHTTSTLGSADAVDPVTGGAAAPTTTTTTTADQGWVFPFAKPLAPEPGDNQALAVNTTDGTTEYEAAFALVWVTDEDALNVNEAQAYASCTSCAAVAVAFQVVFVVDTDETDANVAAPQNLAGALNYNCVNCLTYALAQQLFVTLHGPLSEDAMAALDELWAQIAAYGDAIAAGEVPVDEIGAQLEQYKDQILAIVETDQPGTLPSASSSAAASGSASASASGPASPSALPQGTTTTAGTTSPAATTTDSTAATSGTSSPSATPDGASSSPGATSPTASPTADATASSGSTVATPAG